MLFSVFTKGTNSITFWQFCIAEQSRQEDAVRKYSLPLKIEVLSVANGANTKPLDVVGDEWLITDTYEDLFLKINHINEDGNSYLLGY